MNRIESLLRENRVKLHLFEPSGRKIWSVVGKKKEYWIDPDIHYCACSGYHFAEDNTCYHLDLALLATQRKMVETIRFSDDEFGDFISGLILEL